MSDQPFPPPPPATPPPPPPSWTPAPPPPPAPLGPPAPAAPATPRDLLRPLAALGVGLLATAVVLSTYYTRDRPHLDWSNYVVGLAATLGLLGIAALGLLRLGRDDRSSDLVAWPGAFGAAAVGLMIGVGLDDSAATEYVAGLAVLAVSVAGVLLTGRGPFVVSAVAGVFVVLSQGYDDSVGFDGDDQRLWPVALVLLLFAVAVTAAGWVLPTRAVSGVAAGAIATVGFAGLTGVLAVTSAFQAFFYDPQVTSGSAAYSSSLSATTDAGSHVSSDTWTTLVLALLLMLFWTGCAVLTGAVGFRVLVVLLAVSVTPLATLALRVEHPTWWGVVLGALGGATLLAALVLAARPVSWTKHPGPNIPR